ncbi:Zinc finger protein dzip1 [Chytriomyces hyalinus]|nr:Zinc finger protein dzip1 [Chytriomyces hyalinus]
MDIPSTATAHHSPNYQHAHPQPMHYPTINPVAPQLLKAMKSKLNSGHSPKAPHQQTNADQKPNIYTKPRASKVVDVDEHHAHHVHHAHHEHHQHQHQQQRHSRKPGNWFPKSPTPQHEPQYYTPQPEYYQPAHGFNTNYAPSVNVKDVYSGLTTGFYFKRRTERLDWRLLASLQVDRVQREVDILALQEIMENVTFCDLDSEDIRYVDPNFVKLIKIAQLIIEYLIHTQDYLAASQGALSKDLQDTSDRLALLTATYEKQVPQQSSSFGRNHLITLFILNQDAELSALKKENRTLKKTLYAYQLMARVPGHAPDVPNNDVATYHRCGFCTKVFKSRAYLDNHMIRRHPDNMHQYQQRYPPQNQPYFQQNYPQNSSYGARGMQQPGEPAGPPPWWPQQQGGFSKQPDSNNAVILDLVSRVRETQESMRKELEERVAKEVALKQATLNSSYEQERLKHDEEIQGLKTAIFKQLSEERAQFEEEKAALKDVLKKADKRSRFGSLEDDDLCPNPLSQAPKSKDIAVTATPEAPLKVEDQINKMKETMTADHERDRKDLESRLKKASDQIFALREALLQEHQLNEARDLEVKKLLSTSASTSSNAVAKGIMGAAGVAGAAGLAQTLLASQNTPQSNALGAIANAVLSNTSTQQQQQKNSNSQVIDGLKTAAAIAGATGMLGPGSSPNALGAITNVVLSGGHEQNHGMMGNAGNAMAAAAGAAAVAGLAHSMMGGHEKPAQSSALTTMAGALMTGAKHEQNNGIMGNLGQAMSNASTVSDAVGMASSLMRGEAPTSAQLGTLANAVFNNAKKEPEAHAQHGVMDGAGKMLLTAAGGAAAMGLAHAFIKNNKKDTSTDSSDDAPLSTLFASKKAEKARISATEGSFGDSSDDAPLSSLKPKSPKKTQADEISVVSDTPPRGQPRKNLWPLVGLASTVAVAASVAASPSRQPSDRPTSPSRQPSDRPTSPSRQPSDRPERPATPKGPKSPRLMSLVIPGAVDLPWTTALELMQGYERTPLQQAPWIKTLYPQNESQLEKEKRLIMQNVDKILISRGIQGSEMTSQWYRPEVQASFEAATARFATDIKQKDKSSRIYKEMRSFLATQVIDITKQHYKAKLKINTGASQDVQRASSTVAEPETVSRSIPSSKEPPKEDSTVDPPRRQSKSITRRASESSLATRSIPRAPSHKAAAPPRKPSLTTTKQRELPNSPEKTHERSSVASNNSWIPALDNAKRSISQMFKRSTSSMVKTMSKPTLKRADASHGREMDIEDSMSDSKDSTDSDDDDSYESESVARDSQSSKPRRKHSAPPALKRQASNASRNKEREVHWKGKDSHRYPSDMETHTSTRDSNHDATDSDDSEDSDDETHSFQILPKSFQRADSPIELKDEPPLPVKLPVKTAEKPSVIRQNGKSTPTRSIRSHKQSEESFDVSELSEPEVSVSEMTPILSKRAVPEVSKSPALKPALQPSSKQSSSQSIHLSVPQQLPLTALNPSVTVTEISDITSNFSDSDESFAADKQKAAPQKHATFQKSAVQSINIQPLAQNRQTSNPRMKTAPDSDVDEFDLDSDIENVSM